MTNKHSETVERERIARILLFYPQETKADVNAVIDAILASRAQPTGVDDVRKELNLAHECLTVPPHKLEDTAFLRASVLNARRCVEAALSAPQDEVKSVGVEDIASIIHADIRDMGDFCNALEVSNSAAQAILSKYHVTERK